MGKMYSYMTTVSGKRFYPFDPTPESIDINDVAHALSNLCRFGGHTSVFYSVAQHSVIVSQNVSKKHKLTALLHDAAEGYVTDMISPIKVGLPDYQKLIKGVELAVCERFDLPKRLPKEVVIADTRAAVTEKRDVMPHNKEDWSAWTTEAPFDETIIPLRPPEAKELFLATFYTLLEEQENAKD